MILILSNARVTQGADGGVGGKGVYDPKAQLTRLRFYFTFYLMFATLAIFETFGGLSAFVTRIKSRGEKKYI